MCQNNCSNSTENDHYYIYPDISPASMKKNSVSICYIQRGGMSYNYYASIFCWLTPSTTFGFTKTLSQRKAEQLAHSDKITSAETPPKPPAEIAADSKKKILHKQTGILPTPHISASKSLQIIVRFVAALSQRQAAWELHDQHSILSLIFA